MASPKSLKRSFYKTDLGNSQCNEQAPQHDHDQPDATPIMEMFQNQNDLEAPSIESSRLSSPAPSYSSSSAARDVYVQTASIASAPNTTPKKPKLISAEKDVHSISKEAGQYDLAQEKSKRENLWENRDRQRTEEKAKKDEEKRIRDLEKAAKQIVQDGKSKARDEEKAKRAQEKRARDLEKEAKRLIVEAKVKVRAEEKHKRDQEKAKKAEEKAKREEEQNKKAKSQLRLNAFFAQPTIHTESSRDSPTRDGQTPSRSRCSSVISLQGQLGERSTSASPRKSSATDYEKLFPPFFLKSHTTLGTWNRFLRDEGEVANVEAQLDNILRPHLSSSPPARPSALQAEFGLRLLNTHLRRRKSQKHSPISVKEIVARINGTAKSPIDLTLSASRRDIQQPVDMLKKIPVKFLKFAEDVRPPYIGTYTKLPIGKSSSRLSRNPFARELPSTDYDYDSEAEWVEGEEGEDLDSEGEEDIDDDDAEDLEGFLDDADADEAKKRRPIIGDLEPTCSGLCWEDSQARSHQANSMGDSFNISSMKLDILLDNPMLPIDPYSTSYWQTPLAAKPQASPSRMDPPRIPLNAISRPNLQLANPSKPDDSTKSISAGKITSASNKTPKQPQVKRLIPAELLADFKVAVQGSELTKLGIVEVLKKQFPKQSKGAITDTLMLVAERVGPKESEKRWILKEGS